MHGDRGQVRRGLHVNAVRRGVGVLVSGVLREHERLL